MKNLTLAISLSVLLSSSIFAVENTRLINKNLINTINTNTKVLEILQISKEELTLARELQNNYGNFIPGKITPLEYLGIFAATKQDREKYAALFAKIQRQTTKNILAFDSAVANADKDLFGNDKIINYIGKNKAKKRNKQTLDINNCDLNCQDKIKQLTIQALLLNPVDLYFANATNKQIQEFATQIEINITDVANGTITLNHAQ